MTPREKEAFYSLVERLTEEAYRRGYKDGEEGEKAKESQSFTLTRNQKVLLQSKFDAAVKSK